MTDKCYSDIQDETDESLSSDCCCKLKQTAVKEEKVQTPERKSTGASKKLYHQEKLNCISHFNVHSFRDNCPKWDVFFH